MSSTGPGDAPDARNVEAWTSETLPMSMRTELLHRELARLGLGKGAARGGPSPQASEQPQPATGRPTPGGEPKPRGD